MTGIPVLGSVVDDETRCIHYSTREDVIAIRFRCCGDYYPCHRCHEESAGHPAEQWPLAERERLAVMCGVCRNELSIADYLTVSACPNCNWAFNPGCRLHTHLYFQTS